MIELPDDDKHVRQILLTTDRYVIIDDVLYHYNFPRTRRINKAKEVIRQLVVPKHLKHILEFYHMQQCKNTSNHALDVKQGREKTQLQVF